MKVKKIISKFLIIILIFMIIPIKSMATSIEEIVLNIRENRYFNGESKHGYALNTSGNGEKGHHLIFQIMNKEDNKKTNYYCLDANSGTTWTGENVDITNSDVTYKTYYDLNLEEDIEELKNDNDPAYKNIAGNYFNQIWWILNNIYVPTGNEETDNKKREELLSAAGIVSEDIIQKNITNLEEDNIVGQAYKYVPQPNFENYIVDKKNEAIGNAERATEGWYYYNNENEFVRTDIPDELIEVAEQVAIWYYTNYLNIPEDQRSEEYNVRKQGLQLLRSESEKLEEKSSSQWKALKEQDIVSTNLSGHQASVGMWIQDQATILCWYLIDAAQKYADEISKENIKEPLVITKPTEEISINSKHIVNNTECYIIGPIQIDEKAEQIYHLNDGITINEINCDEYSVLSRETLQTSADKKISDKIGKEFYLAIPITWIEKNIEKNEETPIKYKIQFEGTYRFNEKKLRKSENRIEQPVVEVEPKEKTFPLTIETRIDDENPPKELDGEFDLALQKYISGIYSKGDIKECKNAPVVDTKDLSSGKVTTANYMQDKLPIKAKQGDFVIYNFIVYNEGDLDGYVNKITDNIPKGLQFVYIAEDGETIIACDSNGDSEILTLDTDAYKLINEYNTYWALDSDENGLHKDIYNEETDISVSCDVESFIGNRKKLKAYKGTEDNTYDGSSLDKLDVKIVMRVKAQDETGIIIRNEAAITDAEDINGRKQDSIDELGNKILKDRDSEISNWLGRNTPKEYQDDEDYDNILLGTIDLALTKFIVAVSSDLTIEDGEYITENKLIGSKENQYLRATEVETTKLRDEEDCHDAIYKTDKTPLLVPAKSYVLYNIRVYNEGGTDIYAGEVIDHLPENLNYVDCEFNRNYRWQLGSDGKTIKTDYLSYNVNKENNILRAFDKENDDGKGSGLNYKDIQVLCKVNEKAPSGETLINIAEIGKYEDENGQNIEKDIDSEPQNKDLKNEDDNDMEQILIQTFDLSLLKWVNTIYITEDGITNIKQTENVGDNKSDIIPKVEINKKKLQDTIVRFGYTIQVTNEGDIAGYAKEIIDYVPEGLKFYEEDNIGWTNEGSNIISTNLLEDRLLQPGESAQVTIILRWINEKNNLNMKTNIAEISKDENEYGVPDRDSIPNNKNNEEDDIDEASTLLAISTGNKLNLKLVLTTIFVVCIIALISVVCVFLIKKYIL